jgi:hypothetical protein
MATPNFSLQLNIPNLHHHLLGIAKQVSLLQNLPCPPTVVQLLQQLQQLFQQQQQQFSGFAEQLSGFAE